MNSLLDGRGIMTTYSLANASNQDSSVSGKSYSTGDHSVNYDHDDYGRVTKVIDGTGFRTYTYDDNDSVLSVVTSYTGLPDPANNLTANRSTPNMSYNADNQFNAPGYAYDGNGRATS